MSSIEDLAAEVRTAGLTRDDHMLYTIFIAALPAKYEVEAKNLASRASIGRHDIIKAVRERHRLSGNRKKRCDVAMLYSPTTAAVMVAVGRAAVAAVVARKVDCLLYTSPSPRDKRQSRMPSSA